MESDDWIYRYECVHCGHTRHFAAGEYPIHEVKSCGACGSNGGLCHQLWGRMFTYSDGTVIFAAFDE